GRPGAAGRFARGGGSAAAGARARRWRGVCVPPRPAGRGGLLGAAGWRAGAGGVRLLAALAGALEAGLEAGGAPATRAARLAYHWSAAGDQPRALTASIQAAAAAEQVYAFAEAPLQLGRV